MGGRWSRLVLFGTITTELLPTLPGHIPHGNHGRPVTPPALQVPPPPQFARPPQSAQPPPTRRT